jgi:DHA2 family methylenomycin A resistance protein-like MFS transporter
VTLNGHVHVVSDPAGAWARTENAFRLAGRASFITAGEQGWLAPLPGALLAAALVTGLLFVRAERRRPHPLLPLTLFRSRELSGATGVGMIFNLVLYGTLLCLSFYLQQTRHEPVLATGLLLLPSSVFTGAGSLASGRLTARLGPRPPMIAGLTLAAAGTALLATAGTSTPLALIVAGSLLIGLISLAMPAMTAAVVGAAGAEHAGVASGVLNAARQSGGALGVAVLGSLLGRGHALSLHVPLLVATAGYLIAIALVCVALADR